MRTRLRGQKEPRTPPLSELSDCSCSDILLVVSVSYPC